MQTITTKVYGIDELNPHAQARAIEHFRNINVEGSEWSDGVKEEWAGQLLDLGYKDIGILFTGFSSQGDGACFTATLDLEKWLKETGRSKEFAALQALDSFEDVRVEITHAWRYYFATSTDVSAELVDDEKSTPEILEALDRLEMAIKEERERLGNAIYRDLESAYFDLLEDNQVRDAIEANEYQFTANGDYFNVCAQ